MLNMSLQQMSAVVGGECADGNIKIDSISIDTRTLKPGDCYVAIKGSQFDGHDFVLQAEELQASAIICESLQKVNIPQVVVANTQGALAKLGRANRQNNKAKIIGVTGSNGKTTVKEMIAVILGEVGQTLATIGNLNNDIGVPLTLLRLNKSDDFGVIEMGANHPEEIAYLGQCAEPDIGVITNVSEAHLEGFESLEGVAKTKCELLESLSKAGIAVLNKDDAFFDFCVERAGSSRVISFGLSALADVSPIAIKSQLREGQFMTRFTIKYQQELFDVKVGLVGDHNIKNVLAASAVALALGVEYQYIQKGLEKVKPVPGRLEPYVMPNGGVLINDTYNANPASLTAALTVLKEIGGDFWVVLGAMGELGEESRLLHIEVGRQIKSMGAMRLLAIGPDAKSTTDAFGKGAIFFETQEAMITTLKKELTGSETILVKGSRTQKMENIVNALMHGGGN